MTHLSDFPTTYSLISDIFQTAESGTPDSQTFPKWRKSVIGPIGSRTEHSEKFLSQLTHSLRSCIKVLSYVRRLKHKSRDSGNTGL
jgi:hypothetical protein